MYFLLEWTDYSDVFRGLVLLDEDNWHAWRERSSPSMTVMGRVKTEDDDEWSVPQKIPGFQLSSEGTRRFTSPPSASVDDLLYEEEGQESSVDLRRHYDALSRGEIALFEQRLVGDAETAALLGLLHQVEGVVPSDLFIEAWQAAMFHRHESVAGDESQLENELIRATIRGMGSKKKMEQHCEHLEQQGAVALLKAVHCAAKGSRTPGWAEELLLEEDLLSTSALDEIAAILSR